MLRLTRTSKGGFIKHGSCGTVDGQDSYPQLQDIHKAAGDAREYLKVSFQKQAHQCPSLIRIKRFGSSAMTTKKTSHVQLHVVAQICNPTTLGKQWAEQCQWLPSRLANAKGQ
ncbi:hypothetical protein O6P43_023857 [Quillaja saponaria]|uniref:Uncharacterized protein n=1 Tax=Quillaja saponaria TaxID=32244 RepID=A0AAD7PJ75_QUISA|nr:hypothetical protein O6P43_023857 [Quillaja saponaria]